MRGVSPHQKSLNMFSTLLTDFIDMKHELVLLAQKIDWIFLEKELSKFYSHTGQPAMPVRLMVGSLLLKRLYNLGDETLAEAWKMNPYMQYFCGEIHFQHRFPCDPSDFVHFRKRIGEEGLSLIFTHSVELHGAEAKSDQVLSDTTVQENNTTFPTDAKLYKKVIDKCNSIAQKEGVEQRQTYVRKSKQALRESYNGKHPKRRKQAKRAKRQLRTWAGRQVRELRRKLPKEILPHYEEILHTCERIIEQERMDKNKVYSLHKSFTACIAKGKAGKPYEFGNKVGILMNPKSLVVVSVEAFEGNPNDRKTIEPLLEQCEKQLNYRPKEVVYDRGGRGAAYIGSTKISTPKPPKKSATTYQKRKDRKKFRRRAAIEPVFGHLKKHFRMEQNYLHGKNSPKLNAMWSATGWNLKKLMEKLKQEVLAFIFYRLRLSFSYSNAA